MTVSNKVRRPLKERLVYTILERAVLGARQHPRSLSGVKRTWVDALHMSAFDPKRTSDDPLTGLV
jgi:hypothetical protein